MWTKSQKVSAGVLAVAVVAFGVDRWVLDGGGSSPAAESAESLVVSRTANPASSPVAAGPAAKTSGTAAPASTGVSLAARLAAMAESRRFRDESVGDAFRPSEAWVAAAQPPPVVAPKSSAAASAAAPAAPLAPKPDPAAEFQRTHTLSAVMKGSEGAMAIVNGRLYKPGQVIDGFKLTKVGLREARFWGRGKAVTLKLPGQAAVAEAR